MVCSLEHVKSLNIDVVFLQKLPCVIMQNTKCFRSSVHFLHIKTCLKPRPSLSGIDCACANQCLARYHHNTLCIEMTSCSFYSYRSIILWCTKKWSCKNIISYCPFFQSHTGLTNRTQCVGSITTCYTGDTLHLTRITAGRVIMWIVYGWWWNTRTIAVNVTRPSD